MNYITYIFISIIAALYIDYVINRIKTEHKAKLDQQLPIASIPTKAQAEQTSVSIIEEQPQYVHPHILIKIADGLLTVKQMIAITRQSNIRYKYKNKADLQQQLLAQLA